MVAVGVMVGALLPFVAVALPVAATGAIVALTLFFAVKNDMKAIFADKGNNSGLVKNILSGISSKIDLKIAEEAKSGWEEYTPKWQVQKEFINNLNKKACIAC